MKPDREAGQRRSLRAALWFATLVAASVLSAAAAFALISDISLFNAANLTLQDWEVRNYAPHTPYDKNVVVVAIRESTLQYFPYRAPLDREYLADLLKAIASKHPRAIGVDYLFDEHSEQDKDEKLRQAISNLGVPIVVAYNGTGPGTTPSERANLAKFVPQKLRGDATLPEDPSAIVRDVALCVLEGPGHPLLGFAEALVNPAHHCVFPASSAMPGSNELVESVPIVWHGFPESEAGRREPKAFPEFCAEEIYATDTMRRMYRNDPSLSDPNCFVSQPGVGDILADRLAGKVVLIGAHLSYHDDKHRTPLLGDRGDPGWVPGVVIHAHEVAQLLEHTTPPQVGWRLDFLVALIFAFVGGLAGLSQYHVAWRIAGGTVFLIAFWIGSVALYHYFNAMTGLLSPSLAAVFNFAVMDSVSGREARRQRQFIQATFSRYVSPSIVEELIRDPAKASLGGERREMTFLFTDISDFTTFAEQMDTTTLAPLLNAYFDGATRIVLRHGGMVDKFIGDAVFAIFNAPVDLPEHATRAVQCGLELDTYFEDFRQNSGWKLGKTRIGINTGTAVIGNFGSSLRFNYTAQGDAVNVAQRLEGANKEFGTRICVSADTMKQCSGIQFRRVGEVHLKGRTQPVEVWEPLHESAAAPRAA